MEIPQSSTYIYNEMNENQTLNIMKCLWILPLVLSMACGGRSETNYTTEQDCKSFTYRGWRLSYNKFYEKYSVMRIDSARIGSGNERSFLVKDNNDEYGIYGDGWETKHCFECGDASKSLFKNPCDAKKYLMDYYKKIKDNFWQ